MNCPILPAEDIAAVFGLNLRQGRFVEAYLGQCNYNATRAAIKAGYSTRHPRQSAHQVRKNPKVKRAVDMLLKIYMRLSMPRPRAHSAT